MRSYQETGVRWMSMLSHYNLGGILADDMGLGKTVQAITFILSNLKKDESVLITAPASLTYNWASEFEKFTDEIDFVVIDGNKADRTKEIQENHQIYITSYGSFLKDFEDYQDKKLNYLLLDEAQVVKNYSSKRINLFRLLMLSILLLFQGRHLKIELKKFGQFSKL